MLSLRAIVRQVGGEIQNKPGTQRRLCTAPFAKGWAPHSAASNVTVTPDTPKPEELAFRNGSHACPIFALTF